MNGRQTVKDIKIGPCTEQYGVKIPEKLYLDLSKLTGAEKKELKEKVLEVLAMAVHVSRFDPANYLGE